MLTNLELRGFKSWRETGQVRLRPITGLFGANSSGKTSLIQALLLLRHTVESRDRNLVFDFGSDRMLPDLGDFRSVIHGHATQHDLEISLNWDQDEPFKICDTRENDRTVIEDRGLGFRVLVRCHDDAPAGRLMVEEMVYQVGTAQFGMHRIPDSKPKYDFLVEGSDFTPSKTVGRKWPLPSPIKSYGFPDQVRSHFQNVGFVADLELAFEERLRKIHYLGPLRANPSRRYTWTGSQLSNMGSAGELAVDAILTSKRQKALIGRGKGRPRVTLERYVAEWLKKLGLIHEFRVAELVDGGSDFAVYVKKSIRSPEVLLTDIGFGVSQILPVLVLCLSVPKGSTLILEHPEIHLHPRAQSLLADLLIEAWKKHRVQILLESHSEHLLRRLQRRVAEGEISKEDIGLYFCSSDIESSHITPLELDPYGNIRNWPNEFFGDEVGEMIAMNKAGMARRRART